MHDDPNPHYVIERSVWEACRRPSHKPCSVVYEYVLATKHPDLVPLRRDNGEPPEIDRNEYKLVRYWHTRLPDDVDPMTEVMSRVWQVEIDNAKILSLVENARSLREIINQIRNNTESIEQNAEQLQGLSNQIQHIELDTTPGILKEIQELEEEKEVILERLEHIGIRNRLRRIWNWLVTTHDS